MKHKLFQNVTHELKRWEEQFFIPESEKVSNADEKQRVRPPIYPYFAFHNLYVLEVRHYQFVRGLLKVSIDHSDVSKPSRNLFSISSSGKRANSLPKV